VEEFVVDLTNGNVAEALHDLREEAPE